MKLDSNLHAGMTRKRLPGDNIASPPKASVNQDATRTAVGKGHSIGGRVA